MSYRPVVTAALSGATLRQLSYWRSSRSNEAPLLAPELHKPRSRVSYSFRDVVALRTFVYLRSRKVPLQRVRKAVQSLRDMGATEHLSSYQLVADHVKYLGWKGKKDRFLLPDASVKGYNALITNDSAQLDSVEKTRAIRDSGMHHIRYRHDTRRGIDGLALAMAAVMAAIRPVV